MSCTKTAEPVWNAETRGSMGCTCCPRERELLGVSSRQGSIVKHRILGAGQKGELCKNGWIDLNDLCVVWRVLAQGVAFLGRDDCTCVKIFSGVIFKKSRLIPLRVNALVNALI